MNGIRFPGAVLIVAGILGLMYGTFNYTSETHDIKLGTLEMSIHETQTVNVPVWGGVGSLVAGAGLLLLVARKRH